MVRKKTQKKRSIVGQKKRYDLLFSKCKTLKIHNVVTGHHLDDLFENFFIRMLRGSGLKGLVSLEKKTKISSINLIRPLLDFEKENLKFISNYVFDFFVNDPSNENIEFSKNQVKKLD